MVVHESKYMTEINSGGETWRNFLMSFHTPWDKRREEWGVQKKQIKVCPPHFWRVRFTLYIATANCCLQKAIFLCSARAVAKYHLAKRKTCSRVQKRCCVVGAWRYCARWRRKFRTHVRRIWRRPCTREQRSPLSAAMRKRAGEHLDAENERDAARTFLCIQLI